MVSQADAHNYLESSFSLENLISSYFLTTFLNYLNIFPFSGNLDVVWQHTAKSTPTDIQFLSTRVLIFSVCLQWSWRPILWPWLLAYSRLCSFSRKIKVARNSENMRKLNFPNWNRVLNNNDYGHLLLSRFPQQLQLNSATNLIIARTLLQIFNGVSFYCPCRNVQWWSRHRLAKT